MASPQEQTLAQEQGAPEEEQPTAQEPAAALPDYLTDPDAVMKDTNASWRYGKPPDYTNTRKMNHEAGSLPQVVENLVKNWEVEASFKPVLSDWRTIDHANYSFAINGGPAQSAEHMLKVGTYNAIIAPNQYYDPAHSDFHSSHKTFKRMMPTFAWEVTEVFSGPPKVAFRWRHWGVMKNDYVGFNDQGEKVTVKAHGGAIDIQGVTVASVDDKVRLQSVMTWFDPLEMFRQIAPNGIVNKQVVEHRAGQTYEDLLDQPSGAAPAQDGQATGAPATQTSEQVALPPGHPAVALSLVCPILQTLDKAKQQVQELEASISQLQSTSSSAAAAAPPAPAPAPAPPTITSTSASAANGHASGHTDGHANFDSRAGNGNGNGTQDDKPTQQALETDRAPTASVEVPYPHPRDMEEKVQPGPGDAVAAAAQSGEAEETKAELSHVTEEERQGLLNVE